MSTAISTTDETTCPMSLFYVNSMQLDDLFVFDNFHQSFFNIESNYNIKIKQDKLNKFQEWNEVFSRKIIYTWKVYN